VLAFRWIKRISREKRLPFESHNGHCGGDAALFWAGRLQSPAAAGFHLRYFQAWAWCILDTRLYHCFIAKTHIGILGVEGIKA